MCEPVDSLEDCDKHVRSGQRFAQGPCSQAGGDRDVFDEGNRTDP
jgi:hypothetical protein